MRYDEQAKRESQRKAFDLITQRELTKRTTNPDGSFTDTKVANKFYVDPLNVTIPATLTQELPWVNTGGQFIFDFSINAPAQVPGVNNNRVLPKNNVFVIWGLQLLFGTGANAANRVYRSFGLTANDDSLYNSTMSVKMEQSTLIDFAEGRDFRDVPQTATEGWADDGMVLINPVRIITGEMGVFKLFITLLNPISALVISDNTVVSARLKGAMGQASA